jgi:hypothetical protein
MVRTTGGGSTSTMKQMLRSHEAKALLIFVLRGGLRGGNSAVVLFIFYGPNFAFGTPFSGRLVLRGSVCPLIRPPHWFVTVLSVLAFPTKLMFHTVNRLDFRISLLWKNIYCRIALWGILVDVVLIIVASINTIGMAITTMVVVGLTFIDSTLLPLKAFSCPTSSANS